MGRIPPHVRVTCSEFGGHLRDSWLVGQAPVLVAWPAIGWRVVTALPCKLLSGLKREQSCR